MPTNRPVSSLVLVELYDSGDSSFLEIIRQPRADFKPILGLPRRQRRQLGLFSQLEKDRLEGAKPITPRQLPRMAARHNRFCANGEPEAGDKLREGMESLRS